MPHTIERYEGATAQKKAQASGWLEPDMGNVAPRTDRLELIGSNFNDPGPDYCRWIAYDDQGHVLSTKTIDGY